MSLMPNRSRGGGEEDAGHKSIPISMLRGRKQEPPLGQRPPWEPSVHVRGARHGHGPRPAHPPHGWLNWQWTALDRRQANRRETPDEQAAAAKWVRHMARFCDLPVSHTPACLMLPAGTRTQTQTRRGKGIGCQRGSGSLQARALASPLPYLPYPRSSQVPDRTSSSRFPVPSSHPAASGSDRAWPGGGGK